jgi:hypothetical protein
MQTMSSEPRDDFWGYLVVSLLASVVVTGLVLVLLGCSSVSERSTAGSWERGEVVTRPLTGGGQRTSYAIVAGATSAAVVSLPDPVPDAGGGILGLLGLGSGAGGILAAVWAFIRGQTWKKATRAATLYAEDVERCETDDDVVRAKEKHRKVQEAYGVHRAIQRARGK